MGGALGPDDRAVFETRATELYEIVDAAAASRPTTRGSPGAARRAAFDLLVV